MSSYLYTWDVVQHRHAFPIFSNCDKDWIVLHGERVTGQYQKWDYVICNNEMAKWWDIEGASKLRISISTKPSPYAYKCKQYSDCFRFIYIQDENTSRWYLHGAYLEIGSSIEKLIRSGFETWYLGVEILEWE